MFKHFLTFLLFLTYNSYGQTETFTEKSVGSTGDFTNQPISLQSEYSHSQTIYYPNDMEFKGEITEIRFRSAFYQSKRENVGNWVVNIGYTTKEEFAPGDPFVNIEDLTEVFNGGYDIDGYDVIVRFTTPFTYDGQQNIILDVQDTDDGFTTSLTAGFRGEENFNNPPTRSKMTFTKNGSTSGVYENSFANTRFIGNLERCPISYILKEDVVTEDQASFTIENPNEIAGFRYKIGLQNDDEPDSYSVATTSFSVTDLIPGKNYILYYKSDCDAVPSSYQKIYFNTKPLAVSIPSVIDFEGDTNNYYIKNNTAGFIQVSEESGLNGSTKGLLLNGSSDFNIYNWWEDNGDTWEENENFISELNFTIDLTTNTIQPVFEFSLKQFIYESELRLIIDGQIQEFIYDNSDVDYETTRVISADLSDFKGKKVELVIQYLGKSYLHKSYIDDIELKESNCDIPNNIELTTTDSSITASWDSDAENWEIAIANYDEVFSNTGEIITSKNYTFNNLEKAKPYTIFLRSKCDNSNSPWLKLYKSTKSDILNVPHEISMRSLDIATTADFSINYNRYSKIYQDFYKLLYLDQKPRRDSYGWIGEFETIENQAWSDNTNFISSVSFWVDATDLQSLQADLEFKQHYFYGSNTSWFRVKVNGEQIGSSYNPESVRFDNYTELSLDLSAFVGDVIEVTLEQCGLYGPSRENSITSAGDFTIVRSVNFTSPTLSSENYYLEDNIIYPNPVQDILHINTEAIFENIFVYDVNGKILINQKKQNKSIDVSRLKKGIYFFKALAKNKTVLHTKFIKR